MSNSLPDGNSQEQQRVSDDLDCPTIPHHQSGGVVEQSPRVLDELPQSFGRYRVISMLGRGGFGCVYKAVDEQLERDVAIKVTLGSLVDPAVRQGFLTEAKIVASLDHPNIVPVYDVGRTEQGDFYVISKLISGSDLANRLKIDRPGIRLALSIVEAIAEALHHAHSHGLVHRDIKPANILLDRNDRPYLTDFGIALRESEQGKQGETAGTPAYMSPEQARAEGHRVDNRSDIYSLGVVLYELLTGRRPFRSENPLELMSLIATGDVRSPRVYDDTLSKDLERICMKALARRASERYTVAKDFAEDIRWALSHLSPHTTVSTASHQTPAPGVTPSIAISDTTEMLASETSRSSTDSHRTGPTLVVPKGLRSFDASDAGFFLQLLPGPFDREGLPETLRFWKSRIEQLDSEQTFRVGLIYGPSGCGKSSLVKAGMLPRLSPKIVSVYTESHADETESRLLKAVRKAIPEAEGRTLKEVLGTVRRRKLVPSGGKLLLVLDQFEQWLFSEKDYANSSLTEALRQCDGGVVQAIIMVRDDFWISVSRFLRELDIPILEQENSTLVDLFDLQHAEKVLGLFGRSFGKLPDSMKDWNEDHVQFIKQAVLGLSQERKVISVRLAVFAEMMKSRDWTPTALREVGGIEGVGVTFLEETFSSRHALIQHRQHQEAARGLLGSLLPISGTDIKGTMSSTDALRIASGYESRPREFEQLLQMLDKSLRLITPVDADLLNSADSESRTLDSSPRNTSAGTHYQLTHDFLVPSLRDWLTQKQRESRRGRAALKLAERAQVWSTKREARHLPSLFEWAYMRFATDAKRWTEPQKLMMRSAAKWHLRTWSTVGLTLITLILGLGYVFLSQERRFRDQQTRTQSKTVKDLVEALQASSGPAIEVNLQKLKGPRLAKLVSPELKQRFQDANEPKAKLALAFGLASFGDVQIEYLMSRIHDLEDADINNMIMALGMNSEASSKALSEAYAETTKALEELDKPVRWSDPPLDSYKEEISKEDIVALERARGMVHERFAICQSMSWERFLALVDSMKPAGYRPVRIRPHRVIGQPIEAGSLMVAAVWLRDNKVWSWEKSLSKEQLIERNRASENERLSLQEVAGYVSDESEERYLGVWVQENTLCKSALLFGTKTSDLSAPVNASSTSKLGPAIWHSFGLPNSQIRHVLSYTDTDNKDSEYWYGSQDWIDSKLMNSNVAIDLGMYDDAFEDNTLDSLQISLVQRENLNMESRGLLLLSPEEHLVQMRKLVDEGYRPVSIAFVSNRDSTKSSSIWQRPADTYRETKNKDERKTAQHRRQARLALVSLGVGDKSLANRAVDFISNSTHEPHSWFVKDLTKLGPKIEKYLYQVGNTQDSAIRSALCLSLGQLPKQEMNQELYDSIIAIAKTWYSQPDRTTHASAAWLLRRFGEPVPAIDNPSAQVPDREWFINSRGTTMVLVEPTPKVKKIEQPDPLEKYRRRLKVAEALGENLQKEPLLQYDRAVALYSLGQFPEALEEFDRTKGLTKKAGMLQMYRCLALAKLGRESEADSALKRLVATQSKLKWKLKYYHWKPSGSEKTPSNWQEILQSPLIAESESENLSLSGIATASPAKDVRSDYFAVEATVPIVLPDDPYTIEFSFDDGIRVWLDDKLMLEKWAPDQDDSEEVVFENNPGKHQLRVEYFHTEGPYKLKSESPSRDASSFVDYARILVPLWLGKKQEALVNFRERNARKESLDQSELYALACAGSLLATSLGDSSDDYELMVEESLGTLDLWLQGSGGSRREISEDMDFLGIRNHPKFQSLMSVPDEVPSIPYWISSREVSRSDFQTFLTDDSYKGEKANEWRPDDFMGLEPTLTGEHPIQNVTWYEAVMFCNWLSSKEGFKPAYRLFGKETIQFKDDNDRQQEMEVDRWILDPAQDGYRLPTQLEWEFACRAGTRTKWFPGDSESLLSEYGQIKPSYRLAVCGSKLPNAWGLHDTHGNVSEWCQDTYARYSSNNGYRPIRGGCSHKDPSNCQYSMVSYVGPTRRIPCIGFRVVRTATEKGSSPNRTAMK
jgi:serine/threonine protein kinase/tetratricopeptide (TPR) repeat protein